MAIDSYLIAVRQIKVALEELVRAGAVLERFADLAATVQANPTAMTILQNEMTQAQRTALNSAVQFANNRAPDLLVFCKDLMLVHADRPSFLREPPSPVPPPLAMP